ncbi:MAG: RluA family pseudouridine synthase [Ardenticatenaceae bacterium]|nr:RluA family pseudouridine synthase [Ardenticatenaceae bacterium]
MEISTKVKPPARQVPLLEYLSQRFTYRTPEAWRQLILEGHVKYDGVVAGVDTPVSAGHRLTTYFPDAKDPEANFDYEIIYEDRWLLAVNKPSNLQVHGRGAFIHANLIHHVRHVRHPAYPEAELINRLDGNTSGAVLLARDKVSLRQMQHQFRTRMVRKRYVAWVHGVPHPTQRVINRPIGQLPSLPGVYRYGSADTAGNLKSAATYMKVLAVYESVYAQVELRPYTGRTHQLRVHMAEIGHPLVGDLVYQVSDEEFLARHENPAAFPKLLLERHALHCSGYVFIHPHTKEVCRITASLPSDLKNLAISSGN